MVPRMYPLCLVLFAVILSAGAAPAAPQAAQPAPAKAAQVPVLAVTPADLPADQVDPKGWSEPTKVDERAVRLARAGRDAWLRSKPWWTGGSRPAEGGYWIIEVVYKDTASQPIIFSAFGNLAKYGDRTELHRFGGLADGQWKTVRIPIGADMIMARPVEGLVEFSIRPAGADVPVASIRVTDLPKAQVEQAAAQYNAETREWVARVQAAKQDRPRNEFAAPQQPAPVVLESKAATVAYVRSYLQMVYPYSAPQENEINRPIQVTMALDEYEPAAFGVYANGKDLTNVRILVDLLRSDANPQASLSVTVRTAEYSLVQNPQGRRAPAGRRGRAAQSQAAGRTQPAAQTRPAPQTRAAGAEGPELAVFPQRLWPMYPTRIPAGQSGMFWLTFQADPKTTMPGLYKSKAVISCDQGNAVLEIRVRVLPFQLVDMKEAGLVMGGCVSGLLPRHEMEAMLQRNHNIINLWLSGVAPTILPKGKDDFDLDFALMDDFMAQAKAAGIQANVWFLGGDPYNFPMTITLERILATNVLGLTNQQYSQLIDKDRMNIPPQIVPLYRKWVEKVMRHAQEKGWPEQILTPFDEPAKWVQTPGRKTNANDPNVLGTGPWIKPHFQQACKLIHEAWPSARIYGSIHHAEPGLVFLDDIDIFCTNAIHEDPKLGDKVRDARKVFWQYSNVGNGLPDRGRYAFGFFFNAFDSRGSLCWAYNWGPRLDTTEGANWEYAWYTPLDLIPAPYYEAVREAWDDRRYVETLKKIARQKNADITAFLAEIADAGANLRGEGGRDTVNDFWAASKRIEAMDELRARVVSKILEIQGLAVANPTR